MAAQLTSNPNSVDSSEHDSITDTPIRDQGEDFVTQRENEVELVEMYTIKPPDQLALLSNKMATVDCGYDGGDEEANNALPSTKQISDTNNLPDVCSNNDIWRGLYVVADGSNVEISSPGTTNPVDIDALPDVHCNDDGGDSLDNVDDKVDSNIEIPSPNTSLCSANQQIDNSGTRSAMMDSSKKESSTVVAILDHSIVQSSTDSAAQLMPSVGLNLIGQISSDNDDITSSSSSDDDSCNEWSNMTYKEINTRRDRDGEGSDDEGEDNDYSNKKSEAWRHGYPMIKDEIDYRDLSPPPDEDMSHDCPPSIEIAVIGSVKNVTEKLIVIESLDSSNPLDEGTLLFNSQRKSVGKLFETFGPVKRPYYTIRVIDTILVQPGEQIYAATGDADLTKYAFMQDILGQKGSDASWRNDQEVPEEFQDFSDDEQEKLSREKHAKRHQRSKRVMTSESIPSVKKHFSGTSQPTSVCHTTFNCGNTPLLSRSQPHPPCSLPTQSHPPCSLPIQPHPPFIPPQPHPPLSLPQPHLPSSLPPPPHQLMNNYYPNFTAHVPPYPPAPQPPPLPPPQYYRTPNPYRSPNYPPW